MWGNFNVIRDTPRLKDQYKEMMAAVPARRTLAGLLSSVPELPPRSKWAWTGEGEFGGGWESYTPASGMQDLYASVASGAVKITPAEFDLLLTDQDRGMGSWEFSGLPADVQAGARANPQQFMRAVLDNRNPANGDLLSIGAEGGVGSYDAYRFSPQAGFGVDQSQKIGVNDDNFGDFLSQYGGAIAGGLAMLVPGMQGWAAGAIAGAINGANKGGIDNIIKGGAIGGATGWAGGQIANGVDSSIGFNPAGADAIWSAGATPLSSFGATTGVNALTGAAKGAFGSTINGGNPVTGAVNGGISSGINSGINAGSNALGLPNGGGFDWAKGALGNFATGSVLSDLWNNTSTPKQATTGTNSGDTNQSSNIFGNIFGGTGGNMADNSIGDWAKSLSPFISSYMANRQRGGTGDTYNKAYDLITNPSADQAKYRGQLDTLMSNPGSMNSSPVYQAMQDAGMNSVNRTSAAAGMLGSGNRLMDLMNQGQKTASQYYFPQQQALASLSGIQGDSAQRTLGAGSLIQGNTAQNEMQNGAIKELMKGFGVQTPQDQFLQALLGKSSENSTGSNPVLSALQKIIGGGTSGGGMDWLTQSGSTTDPAQLRDLLNQQGGFNWSGQDGTIGGSQQDQQLYDQWNPDWFSNNQAMPNDGNYWG